MQGHIGKVHVQPRIKLLELFLYDTDRKPRESVCSPQNCMSRKFRYDSYDVQSKVDRSVPWRSNN